MLFDLITVFSNLPETEVPRSASPEDSKATNIDNDNSYGTLLLHRQMSDQKQPLFVG